MRLRGVAGGCEAPLDTPIMILWVITPTLALRGRVFYIRTPGMVLMDTWRDIYLRL